MDLVRRFLLGRIPAYVEGALNIVDVRDIAKGHLLAEKKGKVGERYILGGRNFTLDRLFADLSRLSGVPAPALRLPAAVAAHGAEFAMRARLPITASPDEIRSGRPVVDVPEHEGQARAGLQAPARTRRRWRTPCAGRATFSATA